MFRCLTLILFLFCFYSGLVAADKTDDNALLLQLDKMIEQREVYQKKVEKEITELRKMLDYVGDDKAKFDILSDLFVMYRSFKVDTALIVAEERLQLADRLGEEYVNQGLMNLADALNKIGKHEKALEVLDRVKRTEAVRKDTYFYYLYHTTYLSCYNDETEASRKRLFMRQIKAYKDTLIAISDPNTASYVTSPTDYLPLLSEFEYHGTRTYANSAEQNFQQQYAYYQAGNSKVHYKHNATGTAAYAWCRSVGATDAYGFCLVPTGGNAYASNAYYSWAVAPGFAA